MSKPSWRTFFGLDLDRHRIARSLFVRGLGVIYLVAIASWWSQAVLLVGENGLSPAGRLLEILDERIGETGQSPFLALPNLFWWTGASDLALHITCGTGVALAALVIAGRLGGPALAGLWAIYLSLLNTGGVFMSFQWDILLLEAGFLAIFLASWKWKSPWRDPPPLGPVAKIALVFAWLLAAKLMLFSGWVKLAWAIDAYPEWWPDRSAMTFHYMTQPIPSWTAWHAHHWPEWFHHFSIWPMYFVELVLPFAVFFGRFGRLAAAAGFIGLMVLVLSTGNYTYFNWLTIVVSLPLVHDRFWPGKRLGRLGFAPGRAVARPSRKAVTLQLAGTIPFFLVLALVNLQIVLGDLHNAPKPALEDDPTPQWLDDFRGRLAPFQLASGYGLFRTMTTDRPEIILEGSQDGITWFEYDFAWKIDDVSERPRFVAPHQPRVAWQFWFAALERRYDFRSRNAGWIEALVLKLLRGEPEVKALLDRDPFPDSPPRLIRGRLYLYEFTTPGERGETGDWWTRVVAGDYLPPVSLPDE